MENSDFITAQLVAIWKRLDDIERKVDGLGPRLASTSTYLNELRREAEKILRQMR